LDYFCGIMYIADLAQYIFKEVLHLNDRFFATLHLRRARFTKRGVGRLAAATLVSALFLAFSLGCAGSKQGQPPGGLTMDQALNEAAAQLLSKMDAGAKVAVLNYTSPSVCLAEYVISEIEASLIESGKVTVVDRKELDLIRSEQNFQFSGEVSNESIQQVGVKLGAQIIITGTRRRS
jgi:hypothetical protein